MRRLPLLCLLLLALPAAAQDASLTLDPRLRLGMPLPAAVEIARGRGLAATAPEPAPGSAGRQVVVATPAGDRCTPRGAFLRCEGLRLYAEGSGRAARLVMVEQFQPLPRPQRSAELLQRAVAQHGPPQEMWREYLHQDGQELFLLRYRWLLRQSGAQQELVLRLQPDQPARGRDRLPPEAMATGVGLVLHPVR